ncbi:MAG: AsmA family protein [Gammaproteobacteria bacterium]|nr:AsmA family protein [Gammaproteobacteria bacterium]
MRFPVGQAGRVWSRVLIGSAIAVVVLFAAAFMALSFFDWNKYISLAAAEVKTATGRELRVAGQTEVGLLPLRLIVDDVSLANATWGSRPQMITAKRVEVRAALLPLLTGDVRLKVDLVEPDVLLETDAKGVGNWVITAPARRSGRTRLRTRRRCRWTWMPPGSRKAWSSTAPDGPEKPAD